MSVINKALSEMTEKKNGPTQVIEKVDVAPIKSSNKMAWLVGGAALCIGLGAWALSAQQPDQAAASLQSAESEQVLTSINQPANPTESEPSPVTTVVTIAPPTTQQSREPVAQIYQPESEANVVQPSPKTVAVNPTATKPTPAAEKPVVAEKTQVANKKQPATRKTADKPLTTASVTPQKKQQTPEPGVMEVVQVELTHQQLADKASARAKKALEANDFSGAIKAYKSALRYTPRDVETRKRIAALYYGRGDARRAVKTLQQGIEIDNDSQPLRLALVNVLIKENLPQAALGVVAHLPEQPSVDYLAARAGLAQQVKRSDLAMESYQLLAKSEPTNAKWWLGLGIEQERAKQLDKAHVSYSNALERVGLSSQTHNFIRSRLSVIEETKGAKDAN